MDDKTKLYVFEKKEVFLIFVFMLLISVISFLLGLKLGQEHGEGVAGITPADKAKVEQLLSKTEEEVQDIVDGQQQKVEKKKDLDLQVRDALKREFEKEFTDQDKKFNDAPKAESESKENNNQVSTESANQGSGDSEVAKAKEDGLTGKYTVQLGAYRSLNDAEQFAKGFKVRGYKPIINEVDIPSKGTYFRVSLGIHETIADAKSFIIKEKALFRGEDYIIVQFD